MGLFKKSGGKTRKDLGIKLAAELPSSTLAGSLLISWDFTYMDLFDSLPDEILRILAREAGFWRASLSAQAQPEASRREVISLAQIWAHADEAD